MNQSARKVTPANDEPGVLDGDWTALLFDNGCKDEHWSIFLKD